MNQSALISNTKTRPADESDLSELSGRMYQSIEIQMGIEEGRFKSLSDLAKYLKTQSVQLNSTIQGALAGENLVFQDCFMVLKSSLPNEYKEALKALKGQAEAVTAQIVKDHAAKRNVLKDAPKRMAQYEDATKAIYRLLMESEDEALTIHTLDEQRLAQELGFT
jgi:HPt (histidine-containing phosphotransfer) domain-containing protein